MNARLARERRLAPRACAQSSAGEFGDRVSHLVVVGVHDDHVIDGRRDAHGCVPRRREFGITVERFEFGCAEDEARQRDPVVGPRAVRTLEKAFRATWIEDPGVEALPVGTLGALPGAERRGQHALQHRRVHVLPTAGDLTCDERGVDGHRRVVERRDADPGNPAEQRTVTVGTDAAAGRRFVARHDLGAGQPPDRCPENPSAFELLPRPRRDERVVGGSVTVPAGLAVAGDRAVHETRVFGHERLVIDAERCGNARAEALDDNVSLDAREP